MSAMDTAKGAPKERKTLPDYGLTRVKVTLLHMSVAFLEPYVDPARHSDKSWVGFHITDPNDQLDEEISSYAVSTQLNAYVIFSVFLTYGTEPDADRVTDMRHRDMMVDNYRAAGGDLSKWRYIAAKGIVNNATTALVEECFKKLGGDFNQAGTIEYLPSHPGFQQIASQNPFTGGVLRLLNEYNDEMGRARIKRFIFISMGLSLRDSLYNMGPELHMVIELCRPGEEGYHDDKNTYTMK